MMRSGSSVSRNRQSLVSGWFGWGTHRTELVGLGKVFLFCAVERGATAPPERLPHIPPMAYSRKGRMHTGYMRRKPDSSGKMHTLRNDPETAGGTYAKSTEKPAPKSHIYNRFPWLSSSKVRHSQTCKIPAFYSCIPFFYILLSFSRLAILEDFVEHDFCEVFRHIHADLSTFVYINIWYYCSFSVLSCK